MSAVQTLVQSRPPVIATIAHPATVLEAVRKMNELGTDWLLVTDNEMVVGIVTGRDVLRKVVAMQLQPANVSVLDAMTRDVICCLHSTSLEDAYALMVQNSIQHVPVVHSDSGELLGVITIDEVNRAMVQEDQVAIQYLHESIQMNACV